MVQDLLTRPDTQHLRKNLKTTAQATCNFAFIFVFTTEAKGERIENTLKFFKFSRLRQYASTEAQKKAIVIKLSTISS